ncbi:hypothetical protein [Nocardia transvalensis]|uniref:hypothetical protein n=1 Tax=Nocardia transvalensis TaxID=37333 RepID=UPI001894B881|nr:hypothetical protein [Nocardia transvalensis]MBF6333465.1 hypothetical protein [Nocardia transvalensis]
MSTSNVVLEDFRALLRSSAAALRTTGYLTAPEDWYSEDITRSEALGEVLTTCQIHPGDGAVVLAVMRSWGIDAAADDIEWFERERNWLLDLPVERRPQTLENFDTERERRERAHVSSISARADADEVESFHIDEIRLEYTFGPQWREIVALVRILGPAPEQQIDRYLTLSTRRTSQDSPIEHARQAVEAKVVSSTERREQSIATRQVLRSLADIGSTADDPVNALIVRDLIDEQSFTTADYNALTTTWREVFGCPSRAPAG